MWYTNSVSVNCTPVYIRTMYISQCKVHACVYIMCLYLHTVVVSIMCVCVCVCVCGRKKTNVQRDAYKEICIAILCAAHVQCTCMLAVIESEGKCLYS